MYGRVLVEPPDHIRGLFFAPYYFSPETYIFIIKNLYINLAGFTFGLFLIHIFPAKSKNKHNLYPNISVKNMYINDAFYNLVYYLLIIFLFINMFFIYQKIGILINEGYLVARNYNNALMNVLNIFFLPFISILLVIRTSKKKNYVLYLFLFNGILSGLQGARGGFCCYDFVLFLV